jgi:regulator of protease activity HflC (stomatin/prohibitin superfamily)
MFFSTLMLAPVGLLLLLILAGTSVKILREYERAVVFTLGRFQKVRGPGLVLMMTCVRRLSRSRPRT